MGGMRFRLYSRATNMVCRGDPPVTIHLYGLTAAPLAPQRVVAYRPTERFLPAGYPAKGQLTVVLYQKALSRPVRASALSADTLGDWF